MKAIKKITIVILVLCLSAVLFACDIKVGWGYNVSEKHEPIIKEKLATVSDVELDSKCVLSFSSTPMTKQYRITINKVTITSIFTAVNLKSQAKITLPKDGIFDVSIVSEPSYPETYIESDPCIASLSVKGEKLERPELKLSRKNELSWSYDSKALNFNLKVNDFEFNSEELKENKLALTQVLSNKGKYNISFTAKGDGMYIKDSDTLKYSYFYNGEKLQMPTVENVRVEGLTFKFDKIDNAYGYVICDVLNNLYEVSSAEVDLTDKMMVQSVYAKSVQNDIVDGDVQTQIKYFAKGLGTAQSPYEVDSYQAMRYIEYYERQGIAKHYVLTKDIVFPKIALGELEVGSNYMEIGSMSGVLDGKGYSIKGLTTATYRGFVGLFDSVARSGVVKNIVFDGIELRTWRVLNSDGNIHPMGASIGVVCKDNFGLIENIIIKNSLLTSEYDDVSAVSYNVGTVKDVKVEQNIISSGAEGGLIAVLNIGTLKQCSIGVNEYSARKNIAAVCALNYGTIDDCDNSTDLMYDDKNEVGGIVSWNEGVVIRCDNLGAITGKDFVGGIVGKNGGQIINCTNGGRITGKNFVGGITGQTELLQLSEVAGNTSKISECSNDGEIKATEDYAGGITGKNVNGFLEKTVNRGKVSSGNVAGGISGSCGEAGTKTTAWINAGIYKSYNLGTVTGKIVGGISGENASWRFSTETGSNILIEGKGIFNCYSIGVKNIGINNNQVCDSYSDEVLTGGDFFEGSEKVDIKKSKTDLQLKSNEFAALLNACKNCEDTWIFEKGFVQLKWETQVKTLRHTDFVK